MKQNKPLLWAIAILLFMALPILAQPAPVLPVDNATGIAKTPTFTWLAQPGATSYRLQVATDVAFTNIVFNANVGNVVLYVVTSPVLDDGTDYYWHVKSDLTSSYSATRKLTTIETPTLVSPADATIALCENPTLTWNTVEGATNYYIEIWTPAFAGTLVESSVEVAGVGPTQSFTPTLVQSWGSTFEWAVRAQDNAAPGNWTGWSPRWTFDLLGVPTLVSPADLATCQPLGNTLSWSAVPGATNYEIQVATDAGFTNLKNWNTGWGSTSYLTTFDRYDYNSVYYWRVRANNGLCDGGWSTTFSYTTIIDVTTLLTPVNYQGGVSLEPTFTWDDISGETGYQVKIFSDVGLLNLVYSSVMLGADVTTFTVPYAEPGILANSTEYFWVVEASNACMTTQSVANRFTTVDIIEPFLGWPTGCAVMYTASVNFSWFLNQAYPGVTFDLLVDTDPAMAAPTTIASGLTNTYLDYAGLLPGTLYYWRILAYASSGAKAGYSAIECFNTFGDPGLYPPIPSYPLGVQPAPNEIYTLTPTLYWYLNGPATNLIFDVQLFIWHEDPLTATEILTASVGGFGTTGDLYLTVPGGLLSAGNDYKWRVRSKNIVTSETSVWSDFNFFRPVGNSLLRIPVPSYPIGGIDIYTLAPTFYWYVNGPASSVEFDIIYSTVDPGIGGFPDGAAPSGHTSFMYFTPGAPLLPGQTYYWAVRSTYMGNHSEWSDTETFVTYGQNGDITPILTYPIDGTTVWTLNPTGWWYTDAPGAVLFEIEVRAGALTATANYGPTANFFFPFAGLLPGTHYNWAVRAFNGTTWSAWSAPEDFYTYGGAVTDIMPIQTYPIGGPTVYTNEPTLYWFTNSGYSPLTFSVEIYWDPAGSVLVTAPFAAGVDVNNFTVPNGVLVSGATYYWQVFASDGVITVGSGIESFVTAAGNRPVIPIAGSPAHNVKLSSQTATLSWFLPTQSESSLSYDLEISTSADLSNAVSVKGLTSSNYKLNLESNQTYYWRVRSSIESGDASKFSNGANFRTGDLITSAENTPVIPKAFAVAQNYPNPFNPTTTIRIELPENGIVSIKIFNMLGQEVKTLLNSEKSPGIYDVVWNGDDNFGNKVSTGTYIYRVISGENVFSKKMILMK
ncbi:MAG: T9SS type A sorting domain-containing protein [bacterium]